MRNRRRIQYHTMNGRLIVIPGQIVFVFRITGLLFFDGNGFLLLLPARSPHVHTSRAGAPGAAWAPVSPIVVGLRR